MLGVSTVIILDIGLANGIWRYIVALSLIGRAKIKNDSCNKVSLI